jgi:hypothetical protein
VAAGCGSTGTPEAKLPAPRGKLIRVGVSQLPAKRHVRGVAFVKVEPHRALELFRRGELDVAPVPLGDIQTVLRDPQLKPAVRIRRLAAIDAVVIAGDGVLTRYPKLRLAYDHTADRADYQALVPELEAPAVQNLGERPGGRAAAVAFNRARKEISALPHVAVRFAMPQDPALAYGANVLLAAWRDLGLGPYFGKGRPDASFERVYDRSGKDLIPIAAAVDAHLVSPRVQGWRESDRGVVDYTRVRLR